MVASNLKYKKEYDEQAFKLALLGATNEELADFFNIGTTSLTVWRSKYPGFAEAVRKGKIIADAKVSEKLYRRALGYSHDEEKVFCNANGDVTSITVQKHYPPETTACIFWLKNRQPEKWRDARFLDVKNREAAKTLTDAQLERIAASGSEGTAGEKERPQKVH